MYVLCLRLGWKVCASFYKTISCDVPAASGAQPFTSKVCTGKIMASLRSPLRSGGRVLTTAFQQGCWTLVDYIEQGQRAMKASTFLDRRTRCKPLPLTGFRDKTGVDSSVRAWVLSRLALRWDDTGARTGIPSPSRRPPRRVPGRTRREAREDLRACPSAVTASQGHCSRRLPAC
jgi:hypothetical protein